MEYLFCAGCIDFLLIYFYHFNGSGRGLVAKMRSMRLMHDPDYNPYSRKKKAWAGLSRLFYAARHGHDVKNSMHLIKIHIVSRSQKSYFGLTLINMKEAMKVAICGFGAVGGLIGARLSAQGCAVSALARGATLAALRQNGARLQQDDEVVAFPLHASDDANELGVQDLIVIAVKAPALAEVAAGIAPLIGPDTLILPAMNGVPWWFFSSKNVPLHGTRLRALDPDGLIAAALPVRQVIGCVVHLSAVCPDPGMVRAVSGKRLIFGEVDGGQSERIAQLVRLFSQAGFAAEQSIDIRTDIWYKLWGNMTMNPVSAITGARADAVLDDPLVHAFCLSVMQEAAEIGARIACPISQSGSDRIAITRQLGAIKTSMLQDAEAGKPLEIDALVTVVHEIGQLLGVATPFTDGLLGLTRLFGRTHGLYPK